MRILLGIFLGMFGMGIAQGIAGYFIGKYTTTGGSWISVSTDNEIIGMIVEAILGAAVGSILGGLIVGLGVMFPKSIIFSLVFSLFVSFVFFNWSGGPLTDPIIKYTILCFLVFGTTCGTLISLLNEKR